ENHAEFCRRLVAERGWRWVGESSDNSISAIDRGKLEGFDKLTKVMQAGLIDTIVVFEASRLYREAVDFMVFARDCRRAGVRWIVTRDGELSTEAGPHEVQMFISGWQASEERRHLIARTRQELDANAAKGLSHGSRNPPFGYLGPAYDEAGNRIRRNGAEVNPEQAALVREAVDRVLRGEKIAAICRDWNRRSIPAPRGKRWSSTGLSYILRNPRTSGRRMHDGV
ncbi:MAG: hypothetical protein GEU78_19730, partial [Actinobacteria bacterium]|nr:hypothetical protein [Actinomycetota bacterium]